MVLLGVGLVAAWRARNRPALTVAGIATAYLAIIALIGLTGGAQVPRYTLPPLVLLSAVAGGGAGALVRLAPNPVLRGATATACVAALAWPAAHKIGPVVTQINNGVTLHGYVEDAAAAAEHAGGTARLRQCAPLTSNRNLARGRPYSALIRRLELGGGQIRWTAHAPTVAIIAPPTDVAGTLPAAVRSGHAKRTIARSGNIRLVYVSGGRRCGGYRIHGPITPSK